ncbi:MAG TPA: hypothetical protein VL614_14875 [Acetobacteraceae bacterium]|jgi:hypothetical protein|nr:hypothetical protein [Acetobacteraceae bacterium]
MAGLGTLPLQIAGAVGTASLSGDVLQLGSVVFDEIGLEVPESLTGAGGSQAIEEHKFPGGIITHQTFGAFPDVIEWRGLFTGSNAFSRMQQVDLIRIAGTEVPLIFGPKAWMGRVAHFAPTPRHRWLIPYSIRFLPRVDISNSVPSQPTPTPETQLGGQTTALATLAGGTPFPMPVALVSPVAALLTTTALALSAANGIVASIAPVGLAAIEAAVLAVTVATAPAIQQVDPLAGFMALACAARAATIGRIVQVPVLPTQTTLQLVNPNLPLLAAQYLGDATQWRTIATLNGLADPLPVGSFAIQIPPSA